MNLNTISRSVSQPSMSSVVSVKTTKEEPKWGSREGLAKVVGLILAGNSEGHHWFWLGCRVLNEARDWGRSTASVGQLASVIFKIFHFFKNYKNAPRVSRLSGLVLAWNRACQCPQNRFDELGAMTSLVLPNSFPNLTLLPSTINKIIILK